MTIPSHIWSGKAIHIPPPVVADYISQLHEIGRYTDACGESPSGEIGGISLKETHDYFVHRFAASTARTEYFLLDPKKEFGKISTDLLQTFADGRLSILDVPCGSGAGVLGFLGSLHELRKNSSIKTLPLTIAVTAGDYSTAALNLFNKMLTRADPWLRTQGIRVTWKCHKWDAKNTNSTAAIVDNWFTLSPESEEWLVLIAAISGELGKKEEKGKFEENSRFFHHICERMHDRFGAIYWVEPNTNQSEWLLNRLINSFASLFRERSQVKNASFKWHHPLKNTSFNGRLRLLEHRRTGGA